MRLETAGAKTWLFGALTLWAVVLWALAIAGLGGRIERLADDPSLRQRLPQPVTPAEERLGPLPQYATIGDRPVFSEDRLPHPFLINPEGEETAETFDFVLTSVIRSPGLELAIVQPTAGGEPVRIRVGDAPESSPAWTLTSIAARSAVFAGPEGERTLELRVFDGTGGEPPTPVTRAPPARTAGQAPRSPAVQPPQAQPQPQATPPRAAAGGIPVTTSSGQVNVPAPQQPPGQSPAADAPPSTPAPTPDEQAEAIRRRIDARREQLRREAMNPPNETQ